MTQNPKLFESTSVPISPTTQPCAEVLSTNITLRDLFAAAALAGSLSHPRADGDDSEHARWAYRYADAMLAERDKSK